MLRFSPSSSWRWYAAAAVAWVGTLVALPLVLDRQDIFCSGTNAGSCQVVAASAFGKIAGVPLSWLGLAAHTGLLSGLLVAMFARRRPIRTAVADTARRGGVLCAGFALVPLLWQAFVLHAFCPLCVALATTFFLLAGLVWNQRTDSIPQPVLAVVPALLICLVGTGVFLMCLLRNGNEPRLVPRGPDARSCSVDRTVEPTWFDLREADLDGPADAPFVFVVFSDFECPPCRTLSKDLGTVRRALGDRVAVAHKNLPLEKIHPHSRLYALAALAAADQGRFLAFHDAFMHQTATMDEPALVQFARMLGMEGTRFVRDLHSPQIAGRLVTDLREASALGLKQTPTIYLNGRLVKGPLTERNLLNLVAQASTPNG